MFRTMTAKFAGRCKRCRNTFEAGAKIRYGGYGRTYHLSTDPACGGSAAPEAARIWAATSAASNTFTIGGNDFYRNVNGRCEDAPCCGCCTI